METSKKLIIRLSQYKNALERLKSLGFVKVFSDNIADSVGVTPSQVRKDFSIFGIPGNKKGGYLINELIEELRKILGKEKETKVIIIGMGNLGLALMKYEMFKKEGIEIIAGFDIDDKKINHESNPPIYHINQLSEYIKHNKISIGIITVPAPAAQGIMDVLVSAGIKGVLNFTSIHLRGIDDTFIHNINLQTELESLIYFVSASKRRK